jgi:ApeA N-terminal domain 1/Apea-like HEPN
VLRRDGRYAGRPMASRERTLQDSFELRGRFWLPEAPSRQVAGILAYDGRELTLELFEPFAGPGVDETLEESDRILGVTVGGFCTLEDAFLRSARSAHLVEGDAVVLQTWFVHRLFLGAAFDGEIIFSAVTFHFAELETWLGHRPFEATQTISVIETMPPFSTLFHIQLPGEEALLSVQPSGSWSGEPPTSVTVTWEAGLDLRPNDPQPYGWFAERLSDVRALLGLLVGEAATPTKITARRSDRDFGEIEIFFPVVGSPRSRPVAPYEVLLSRETLGERVEPVVQAWFAKRKALKTAVALLFGTLYTESLPSEFHFLALTQALETLHRWLYGGLYLPSEKYEEVERALYAAIPPNVPSDLRQALKARISHGDEFSQRRRFRDLLDSLDEESREAVSADPDFTDRVVDERNYLTHYPEGESPPMAPEERWYATVRLRAFLTLLLLREIGITGEEAVTGVRRTRWHESLGLERPSTA